MNVARVDSDYRSTTIPVVERLVEDVHLRVVRGRDHSRHVHRRGNNRGSGSWAVRYMALYIVRFRWKQPERGQRKAERLNGLPPFGLPSQANKMRETRFPFG